MRLKKEFFTTSAMELAPKLLGKYLCRMVNGEIIKLQITETECYYGENDTACHACKGKTKRNEAMWHMGGCSYVYLCYGMHNMLNVVSGTENFPEAVLIRAVKGFNGPGRVTKKFDITRELNKTDLVNGNELWIEDGPDLNYTAAPRVGINYAKQEDREKLWRFIAV